MAPVFCVHKTLDRSEDGLHYCIDCRAPFIIKPWDHKTASEANIDNERAKQAPEPKKDTVSDSEVPRWVARMYRWLTVAGVLAIIGFGITNYCKNNPSEPETNGKAPEIAENPILPEDLCQDEDGKVKIEEKKSKIIYKEKKCPKVKPQKIKCEPKVVYVPSPNKCTCEKAIEAACGKAREAVKSLLRPDWHDKQIEESRRDYKMPPSRLEKSQEELNETEDLENWMEVYKDDEDETDENGWFK